MDGKEAPQIEDASVHRGQQELLNRRAALERVVRRTTGAIAGLGLISFVSGLFSDQVKPTQSVSETPDQGTLTRMHKTVLRSTTVAQRELLEAAKSPEWSHLRTAAEGVAEYVLSSFSGRTFADAGVRTGNVGFPDVRDYDRKYGKKIRVTVEGAALLVGAPIAEELAFRLFPVLLWISEHEVGDRWDIGTISALLFAYSHNVLRKNIECGPIMFPVPTGFSLSSIPIQQFILGLYTWFAMRRRGYSHAVLAHGIHNLCSLSRRHFRMIQSKAHLDRSHSAPTQPSEG